MAMFSAQSSQVANDRLYVDDVFSTYLYQGNGSTQTINNGIDLAGKGGLVWYKRRNVAEGHGLYDTARGTGKILITNATDAQYSPYNGVSAFNSNGFSLGSDHGNANAATYASWTFRRSPKFFDVVTYTGNGTVSRDIAHSLGIKPGMIFTKRLNTAGSWTGYHQSLGYTKRIYLDLTNAASVNVVTWVKEPTATHFTIGSENTNGDTYVAYLFAHDPSADGIIQCGSYIANGTDQDITLGWEPQFILLKRATNTGDWIMLDTVRNWSHGTESYLKPNSSSGEDNGNSDGHPTATGFRIQGTGNLGLAYAGSNQTMIYLAIRRPNKPPTSGTQVYNAIARTGTGAAATVTGVGFAPDLTLAKPRDAVNPTAWFDRLRGATKQIQSSDTAAETTYSDSLLAYLMDGVSIGADLTGYSLNYSGKAIINHFFKRAPGFFDVVCYTGTGGARTVNHNLGVAPELMIVKSRSGGADAGVLDWPVYASSLGATKFLYLNWYFGEQTRAGDWNDTAPTSTVFTVGTQARTNQASANFIAYLLATLPGISKVGSYTGNGSTQNIECGFSAGARFILIKRTDSVGDWYIWDTVRGIVAGNDPHLSLNTTAAEVTTDDSVDPYSGGFAVNQVAATNLNVTSATYIFLAIA